MPALPAGALMVSDDQLLQGLRQCKELGAIAQVTRPALQRCTAWHCIYLGAIRSGSSRA